MCNGREATGNLCLTRKEGESFRIRHDVLVTVTVCRYGKATISIQAPKSLKVLRTELEEDGDRNGSGSRHGCEPRWRA